MKRLFSSLLFLTAILVTGTVFAASSTNYTIPIDAIGGGGAKSTSTNYQLFDAIGETQGNKASSTNFLIRDGVPAAIQKIVVSGGPVVTPPSSPTSFTTQATSSVVTLTWIEAASTSNFTVEILRDRNPAPGIVSGNPLGVIAKGVQQYVDTTVSPSTAYIYQLRLVDEAEQTVLSSPLTVSTSANTPAVIPLPGIVTLQTPQTGTVLTTKKPLFAWQALSEVLSYQLEIDTAAGNFASPIRTFTIDAPASSYQLKSAEALADGAYQWRVRASNQSGIGSAPLTPFTFTIDTTPPSAPTLLSPSASASVNVRNPEFRWSGDTDVAEYDVQVFVTGITPPATLLTVLASPWTVADSLANGAYTWRVRARDAVGNTSAWSTRTLTIAVSSVVVDDQPLTGEILPPIIPPVQPALAPLAFSLTGPGAIITETKPTFTWSASVNATTYTLEILGDGTAFTKTVANIVTTSYTPAAPLPQGKYLWKVTASNGKGAFIVADPRSLIIDATPPPAPTLSQPSPDAQTALPVALVWTSVQDNLTSVTYTVQVDDGDFSSPAFVTAGTSDVNAASTTTFEINVRNFLNTQYLITNGLTPGITYRWRVWAKDAAGNMSTAPSAVRSFIIPVPAVAPSAFTLAESSEVTIDTTPTFQWTKSDGATAYTLFIQGNGANNTMTRAYPGSTEISFTKLSYTIADPLPLGTYTWYVRATNSAGIYSASSRLLTIATATITEEAQPEDLKIEPLLTLPLTEETAPATPIEEKIAEGVSTPIHSGTIEEAPTITVTLTSSATLATDRPLISGTFSARSTIAQVLIDEQPVALVTVGATGAFVFASPIRLPDGEHTLRFMVDSVLTNTVTFFIDTRESVPATVNDVVVARQQPGAVPGTMDLLIIVQASVDATTQSIALVDPTAKTTILEKTTTVDDQIFFASSVRIAEQLGTHTLLLVTHDQFGKSATQQITYTVTNTPISYVCSDGVDNDADGRTDYPNDPDCTSFTDEAEGSTLLTTLLRTSGIEGASTTVTAAVQNVATTATREIGRATQETVRRTVVVAIAADQIIAASASVVAPSLTIVAPAAVAMNSAAAANLPAIPSMAVNAFSWLFSALGLKKKRKNPWGMIYDAITKDPIGLAIVRLFSVATPITNLRTTLGVDSTPSVNESKGQAKQLLATQVTDKEGRFEFLVKPGQYTLEVVKTPYVFPSKIVNSKEDNDLLDIYHGESVTITSESQGMHVNIPLDPEDPTKHSTMTVFGQLQRLRHLLGKASLPILILGTGMSVIIYAFTQTRYNLLILLVYIAMAAYQTVLAPKKVQSWGTIFDALTLQPVPLALVHIIDPKYQRVIKSRLSDYYGRFTFLPDAGDYQLKVVKQGYAFPSTAKVATKKYHHLYYGEQVTITKKQPIIAADVPLDSVVTTSASLTRMPLEVTRGILVENPPQPLLPPPPEELFLPPPPSTS